MIDLTKEVDKDSNQRAVLLLFFEPNRMIQRGLMRAIISRDVFEFSRAPPPEV